MESSVAIDFSDVLGEPDRKIGMSEGSPKVHEQIQQEIAGHMWQAGTQSAKRFIDMYGQLDYLRPYFNVEPAVVCSRLVRSFVPNLRLTAPQEAPNELYGPIMVIFSLVAVLLFGMKMSDHIVEEGTLIGTALALCFGYWIITALLLAFAAYLVNSAMNFLQILSLMGYCLVSHCCAFLLAIICTNLGHPSIFYAAAVTFGGLTSLKMAGIYMSRSWSHQSGGFLTTFAVSLHLGFLLYLKLVYHNVYEAQI